MVGLHDAIEKNKMLADICASKEKGVEIKIN